MVNWGFWPLMLAFFLLGISWLRFVRRHRHVLIMLLLMEVRLVSLLIGIRCLGVYSWLSWCLIVAGVCERSVGIALLVFFVRFYGRDRVESCLVSRMFG